MPPKYVAFAFVLLSWVVAWAPDLEAGQRRFTFVYDSTTTSKGEVELENWATWKNGRESGNQVRKDSGVFARKSGDGTKSTADSLHLVSLAGAHRQILCPALAGTCRIDERAGLPQRD